MTRLRVCAVIPAAGRGSRLGGDLPKILCPIRASECVWEILYAAVAPVVDHLHVVVSPGVESQLRERIEAQQPELPVTVSVQETPRGMGDAIFGAHEAWRGFEHILVVWGDQVSVSTRTLARTLDVHRAAREPALTLPLARCDDPYVDYVLDPQGQRITAVLEQREGDRCRPEGLSDVGVFALSTAGLRDAWVDYASSAGRGRTTGEINFLPFLAYLSQRPRLTQVIDVPDRREARGLNTPEDLAYFRSLFGQEACHG